MTKQTSFETDIRPLFTQRDIQAMSKAFNLARYDGHGERRCCGRCQRADVWRRASWALSEAAGARTPHVRRLARHDWSGDRLLSLLMALALGTLVGSAYGFFASQRADIESLCARALQLDLALETQPLCVALRDSMQELSDAIRGDSVAYQRHFELGRYMSKFERWNQTLSSPELALAGSNRADFVDCRELRVLPADPAPHFAAVGCLRQNRSAQTSMASGVSTPHSSRRRVWQEIRHPWL